MPLDPTTLITSLYAALCTVLLIALGGRISMYRRRHRIGVGSGSNKDLELAIRAHGNAVETIPLGLLLLLLFEVNGAPHLAVHAFGAVFTAAR
ncbi:MAG: MAPEG family protein, partial [Pseudomonadota bacterium]